MKIKLPQLHEMSLSNGLKVIIGKKSDLPLINIEVMVKAGAAENPAGLSGLSDVTSELITRGSTTITADKLDLELDRSGIALSPGETYDASFLTISGLAEDFHQMMRIISDLLLHPSFPEGELADLKKRRLAQLAERENNPSLIASDTLREILYHDHPYGHPLEGTRDSIKRISIDIIRAFYAQQYTPIRSTLLIMGDISDEDMIIEECQSLFTDWSFEPSHHCALSSPSHNRGINVWLVNKPELTQSQIRFGHIGIKSDNPDFFAIQVMNYILGGGGFASRLMTQIRSVKGYTYGISSTFNPRLERGPFLISTFTANETVKELIMCVYDTINQFIDEGPSTHELDEAKQFFCGNYPLQFDTIGKIAGKLLSVELYNLGRDYIEQYTDNIAAVSLEDVQEAAKKYVQPDNFNIVIVGKSAAYRDALSSLEGFAVYDKEI